MQTKCKTYFFQSDHRFLGSNLNGGRLYFLCNECLFVCFFAVKYSNLTRELCLIQQSARRRVSVVTVTRWHYGSQPLEEHQKLTVLRDSSSLFSFVSVCIIVCILFTCVESVGSFTRLQLKFSCTCSQNLHQYHNSRIIVVYCCDHCHLHQDKRRNFERIFTLFRSLTAFMPRDSQLFNMT